MTKRIPLLLNSIMKRRLDVGFWHQKIDYLSDLLLRLITEFSLAHIFLRSSFVDQAFFLQFLVALLHRNCAA